MAYDFQKLSIYKNQFQLQREATELDASLNDDTLFTVHIFGKGANGKVSSAFTHFFLKIGNVFRLFNQ